MDFFPFFVFFQHQKKGRWRYEVVLLKKWPWQSPLFWSSTYSGMVCNLNSKPKRWQIRKAEESMRQQCNRDDIAANKSWCCEPAHLYCKWRWRRFLMNILGAIGVITSVVNHHPQGMCSTHSLTLSLSPSLSPSLSLLPNWGYTGMSSIRANPIMIDCTSTYLWSKINPFHL